MGNLFNKLGGALKRHSSAVANELIGLSGAAILAYGAWLVYQPAGYIVGGAMLIGAAAARVRR
jgi:hypothetical protein